jgi:hypothetical protein
MLKMKYRVLCLHTSNIGACSVEPELAESHMGNFVF